MEREAIKMMTEEDQEYQRLIGRNSMETFSRAKRDNRNKQNYNIDRYHSRYRLIERFSEGCHKYRPTILTIGHRIKKQYNCDPLWMVVTMMKVDSLTCCNQNLPYQSQ